MPIIHSPNRVESVAAERGYTIDEHGNAFGPKGNRLNLMTCRGYRCFSVKIKGRSLRCFAHRFQAFHTWGDEICRDGVVVRHLDGDSMNNCRENIQIGTQKENMQDRPRFERWLHAVKASEKARKFDHAAIVEFHRQCRSAKQTMAQFNISSKGTLYFIVNQSLAAKPAQAELKLEAA